MKFIILIVDDNVEIIDFLSSNLTPTYTVLSAVNGRDAINLIEQQTVHLVISDIMMPVMDGTTFCVQLKSDLKYSHIPVILLTAKNTLESKIEGLEIGADAYIEKPFSPRHLLAQIENLLSSRMKLQEYYASSPLAHIKSMAFSKPNEEFLEKITITIHNNLKNLNLDVEFLAKEMYMSRATLYRKISDICNLSPNELIRITRLKKAAEFLAEGKLKVYEISELVGFSSMHHFGRSFLKQFKMTPTEFQDQIQNPS